MSRSPGLVESPPSISSSPSRAPLLWALIACYATAYAVLSWLRFESLHSQIDLSYYLRIVWGVATGHWDHPLVQAPHLIGLHLEPILLGFALFGFLRVPLVPLLLTAQAIAVGLAAWPAYRMVLRGTASRRMALTAAVAVLLYPTLTVATLHDFHPVTLAIAPLLGLIDALDERRFARAAVLGLVALSCREDIALQLACVAALIVVRPAWVVGAASLPPRSRVVAAAAGVFLIGYCLGYLVLIQPRYVPATGSYGLHFGHLTQALGAEIHSGRDLLLVALRRPLALAAALLTRDRVLYPVLLLGAVAFLPLARPWPLVGALPVLAVNTLSGFPRVRTLESHYTTAVAPFVLGAALLGVVRLVRWSRSEGRDLFRLRLAVAGALLGCGLVAHIFHGGSPLALRSSRFAWRLFRDEPSAPALRREIRAVPASASVAARPGVLAHLAERPRAMSPPEYDDGRPVDVTIRGE